MNPSQAATYEDGQKVLGRCSGGTKDIFKDQIATKVFSLPLACKNVMYNAH